MKLLAKGIFMYKMNFKYVFKNIKHFFIKQKFKWFPELRINNLMIKFDCKNNPFLSW